MPDDARQKGVQLPVLLFDKSSQTDLLLVSACTARFEDPLFWQTEKVFRFTSTVGQRLRAPDLPFHLYSEPKTPGSRPTVSSLQWFRRCSCFGRPKRSSVSPLQRARGSRLQTFRFTSTASQRLQVPGQPCHLNSGLDVAGSRPSVSPVEWARSSSCRLSVSPLQWVADSRLQAFHFASAVGQRLQVPAFQSKCNFAVGQAPGSSSRGPALSPIQ